MQLKLSQGEMKIAIQGYLSQAVFSKAVKVGLGESTGYPQEFHVEVLLDGIETGADDEKGGPA